MLDVFVCTNPVNYTIAVKGLLSRAPVRRAWVFYDAKRFHPVDFPRDKGWLLPLSIRRLRLLKLVAAFGRVHTVYLPHHRVNKRLLQVAACARSRAYLDDGLDTRRKVPKNFDPGTLPDGAAYFTFEEYRRFPDWLAAARIEPVCSLRDLADHGPAMPPPDLQGIRHVFFEAPGLQADRIVAALGLEAAEVLVVRHPVAAKREGTVPGARVLQGHEINSEALLMAIRDCQLYFGETLLLYVAAALCASSNRLHAQLSPAQSASLVGLDLTLLDTPVADAPLWRLGREYRVQR